MKALITLFFIAQIIYGQSGLTFTKKQMYQDFDVLVATIHSVSPHLPIKKDLWHYDAKKQMLDLRKNIDKISSDLSFFILLESVLNTALDEHTSLLRQDSVWAKQQYEALKVARNKFKFSIGNIYSDGKYLTTNPFIVQGDTVSIGTEIVEIEGEPMDRYIQRKLYVTDGISYDLKRKKFYYAGILKNNETIFKDTLKITLKKNGKSKTYAFASNKFTKYLPTTKYRDSTRVEYWEKEKIIYIRLTDMEPEFTPFINEKLAVLKEQNISIDKIIIDIRRNGGGQDNVWQNLFAELIASPIKYSLKIDDFKNVVMSKEKIERFGFKDVIIKKDKDPLLRKYHFYTLLNTRESIEPSATSLKFTGKIYLLAEQHYSSAGSAVSVASSNPKDNLISVGRKTGYFLGLGFSPQVFVLPNSKVKYRIAPSIEVTNAKNLTDLMQDKIEIEIPYDLNYYQNKFSYKGKPIDKDFLIRFDPFIKAVLEN